MRATSVTVIATLAAGVIGGAVGALLAGLDAHPSTGASSHDQDVVLCTSYALITAALHQPVKTGPDALPAIAPLRLALIENPDADPQIRAAITGAIEAFDAILANGATPRGLSHPPAYDPATVTGAFDRVDEVCGLAK